MAVLNAAPAAAVAAPAPAWPRLFALAGAVTLAVAGEPVATIVDLQPARRCEHVEAAGTVLELSSLAPAVGAWWLLTVHAPGAAPASYHLEAADPAHQRFALDPAQPGTLTIDDGTALQRCPLWPGDALERARRSPLAYAPLCDGALYLRNPVRGQRSALEATTQFLRDHVWRGEQIVGFVRREFYADAFVEKGAAASAPGAAASAGGPPPALPAGAPATLVPGTLGIDVGTRTLTVGRWQPARGVDGVWVSIAQPSAFGVVDPAEGAALAYLVGFDLGAFDLGFALGTDHPRLGWSARVPEARRDARPGPDGIDDAAPLVRTGMLGPAQQSRVVATFAAGFKREHGAFSHGALAAANQGSHYGFVEQGVVFSRLVPGLATLAVFDDGTVEMKTWSKTDAARAGRVRDARQNGVPLVEPGRGGTPAAGALVDRWSAGNWSGSADERMRTLRAGACLVDDGAKKYLVYGWFSDATPRTMSRVFLAYHCRYAMHLDMNALEHTYLALYRRDGAAIAVEHLVAGMAVLDREAAGGVLPRFVAVADDRDFFYLLRRR